MRIAFVSLMSGFQWGGSEALWYNMALHALQNGDDVFVSVYDWGIPVHGKIKDLQLKGAELKFRERFNLHAPILKKITRFLKHRKPALNKDYQSIIDFKPDKVFISQGDSFDLAIHHKGLYQLLIQSGIPYSFVCHNHQQYSYMPPPEIYPKAIEVFKNAQHIFFISRRQQDVVERILLEKFPKGIFTWNPLNLSIPQQPLSWPDQDIAQFAIVASIISGKGQDTAIQVLNSKKWADRKWQLNIYGNGYGRSYIEDMVSKWGLSDRVIFHGHVNDIAEIWKKNHLLLIPSDGEGLPISLVEALACGRPAVVTDVGGNTEVVTENITGFIAEAPSVRSFEKAMENAWEQKEHWQQLGVNAFDKIHQVIDLEPHSKIYDLLKNGK